MSAKGLNRTPVQKTITKYPAMKYGLDSVVPNSRGRFTAYGYHDTTRVDVILKIIYDQLVRKHERRVKPKLTKNPEFMGIVIPPFDVVKNSEIEFLKLILQVKYAFFPDTDMWNKVYLMMQ